MSTDLDDPGDRLWDQLKDERDDWGVSPAGHARVFMDPIRMQGTKYRLPGEPWCSNPECICNAADPVACEEYLGPEGGVWKCPRCGAVESEHVRCTDCGEPCDAVDYRDHDEGHGPQCPHDDPACELRVCEDHDRCETDTDRYTREQEARDEALREQAAEWRAEDPIGGEA